MNASLMITYPFPLHPDFLARIVLPADLTRSEAERLGDMIHAVAQTDDLPEEESS